MFCFNQFGDLERALLREGNVHSADDCHSMLEPVVARYRDADIRRFFRGDAAFADPDLYTFLEEEGYLYAIRLPRYQVRLQLFALAYNLLGNSLSRIGKTEDECPQTSKIHVRERSVNRLEGYSAS